MTPQEAGRRVHGLALSEQRREPGLTYAAALQRVLMRPGNLELVEIYRQPFERPKRPRK